MKNRIVLIAFMIMTAIIVVGCDDSNTNSVSPSQSAEVTPSPQATDSGKEKDALDGYEESYAQEYFDDKASFKVDSFFDGKDHPDKPDCNTYTDGSILFYDSIEDGTPYSFAGPIYDHDMFELISYGAYRGGDPDAVGSGTAYAVYRLIPKHKGKADIPVLDLCDNKYEGTLYHVKVDKNLKCTLKWYARIEEGKNLTVNDNGKRDS